VATIIRFAMTNFTLTFLIIGLVAAVIALARAPKPLTPPVIAEALLAYYVLIPTGFMFFYNFVCHVFFGAMAARFIGWADSPFQAEVGFASLGFAAIGFLAFRRSFDLRLAAVVGPALFALGAAGGHVYQMVTNDNFAPGNAGIVFYLDILIPVIGLVLLWLQHRHPPIPR
jgi:hypothetical protein